MLRRKNHGDAHETAAEAFGRKLGERILDAALLGELDGAAREHQPGTEAAKRPPVVWRSQRKRERALFLRRFLALTLIIFERVGTESKRACSRKLWLGHTYDLDADGDRIYRRKGTQGGLADRIGVTVRELERYLAILQRANILKAWQPMQDKTGRAPRDLPDHMRGEVYAYQVYELCDEMTREVRTAIESFYKKPDPRREREDRERAAMKKIVPGQRGELSASARATAARFLEQFGLGGPDPTIPF